MIVAVGYTVAEVARMLRISEANVLGKLESGEIFGSRVGRLWRVPPKEFHEKFGEAVPISIAGGPAAKGEAAA
jgi:excisionase family DNA binding protein